MSGNLLFIQMVKRKHLQINTSETSQDILAGHNSSNKHRDQEPRGRPLNSSVSGARIMRMS